MNQQKAVFSESARAHRWPAIRERFWHRVNKNGPVHPTLGTACWLWTGGQISFGYGLLQDKGKKISAHRYSWQLHNLPITREIHVLHRCDNPPCVNPAHLFLGTQADNMADLKAKGRSSRYNAKKTSCKYGHPFDAKNTGRKKTGQRVCRSCHRERMRRVNALSAAQDAYEKEVQTLEALNSIKSDPSCEVTVVL